MTQIEKMARAISEALGTPCPEPLKPHHEFVAAVQAALSVLREVDDKTIAVGMRFFNLHPADPTVKVAWQAMIDTIEHES